MILNKYVNQLVFLKQVNYKIVDDNYLLGAHIDLTIRF